MKIFISQVMRGKTEQEILTEREEIKDAAIEMLGDDVEFIDSYFEDYNPNKGCIPLKYLSKAIELLADADFAIFGIGWERARGCAIEHKCAVEYGINVIYM